MHMSTATLTPTLRIPKHLWFSYAVIAMRQDTERAWETFLDNALGVPYPLSESVLYENVSSYITDNWNKIEKEADKLNTIMVEKHLSGVLTLKDVTPGTMVLLPVSFIKCELIYVNDCRALVRGVVKQHKFIPKKKVKKSNGEVVIENGDEVVFNSSDEYNVAPTIMCSLVIE